MSPLQPDRRTPAARLFALYLPQFHPLPENDAWWGKGFTEWTNVTKARPLFSGHMQPRLPRDLGFYDLRLPETRMAQADLARAAGVEGFCYWHYWFGNGRRIMERPFQEVLQSGAPDFPFSLAWANHSWTGIWSGSPENVLLKQDYPGPADEAAHFEWARRAFEDPRYQTVDGRPVFVIFQPHGMPSTAAFIDHWRELAHKAGYPGMYFVAIATRHTAGLQEYSNPAVDPFDAIVPHGPHDYIGRLPSSHLSRLRSRMRRRAFGPFWGKLTRDRHRVPHRYEYADVVRSALDHLPDGIRFLPGVMPGWDNTPRTGFRGIVFEGATPDLFAEYLQKAVDRVADRPPQHRIVFLKAWNEWAEGNYVEPDQSHGTAFLDAMRDVLLPQASTIGTMRAAA